MIYLDTNIILRIASEDYQNIYTPSLNIIETANSLFISPMVELELQYLHEINKIRKSGDFILKLLTEKIGLKTCSKPFNLIIQQAIQLQWTRDPFDRMIVANAALDNNTLITQDRHIQKHYQHVLKG